MRRAILLVLFAVLFLSGCSEKSYYMLSKPHIIAHEAVAVSATVGVERVTVPDYLKAGKVPLQKGNRIHYLDDALWAVDLEDDLTNALIFDLQKSLPKCRIFHYPWDREGRVDAVVSVKIKRFIAQDGAVYLDAVVRVNDRDRVVSLKEPVASLKAANIVAGMQRAFFALEHAVLTILDDIGVTQKR